MARRKVRRSSIARAAAPLAHVPIEAIQAELSRRRRAAGPLIKRRAALAAKLAALDNQLTALGLGSGQEGLAPAMSSLRRSAAPGTRRRGRPPRNGVSLVDTLHKLLSGKELGVAAAAQAVLDSGYKTASKNFRTVVNQTLLVNKERFKKVARGMYTAK